MVVALGGGLNVLHLVGWIQGSHGIHRQILNGMMFQFLPNSGAIKAGIAGRGRAPKAAAQNGKKGGKMEILLFHKNLLCTDTPIIHGFSRKATVL